MLKKTTSKEFNTSSLIKSSTLALQALFRAVSAITSSTVRRRKTSNDVRVIETAVMTASRSAVLMANCTRTSARWKWPPAETAHGSSRCLLATVHRVSVHTLHYPHFEGFDPNCFSDKLVPFRPIAQKGHIPLFIFLCAILLLT